MKKLPEKIDKKIEELAEEYDCCGTSSAWNAMDQLAYHLLEVIEKQREALENLVDRVNRNGGLGEYKGGKVFALNDANEALRETAEVIGE